MARHGRSFPSRTLTSKIVGPTLYTLAAAAGSYLLTGSAATFSVNLITSGGSYLVTGTAIQYPPPLIAGTGSFLVTGNAATLAITYLWTEATKQNETWTEATRQSETWTSVN